MFDKKCLGVITAKNLKENTGKIERMDDRVILTKLILGEEAITILIAYVPQLELHGDVKNEFHKQMDGLCKKRYYRENSDRGGLNVHMKK